MGINLSDLPAFNALMNSFSALFLILGFWAIKSGHKKLHKKLMIRALICSCLFLGSYLTYHFYHPVTPFPELGWIKTIYLVILFTHIILAVVMLPLIFMTFLYAFKERFEKHRKIAPITLAIWLYVSATGVWIYFMLYHWFKN